MNPGCSGADRTAENRSLTKARIFGRDRKFVEINPVASFAMNAARAST